MKILKLSLATAVAVGSMASIASADSLQEALENMEVSGFARYRYENEDKKGDNNYKDISRYSIPVNFKTNFSDNWSANVTVRGEARNSGRENGYSSEGSNNFDVAITKAYVTYKNNGLQLDMGRQAINTPFTDVGYGGNKGDGITAAYTMNNLTFIAAGFHQTNGFSPFSNSFGNGSVTSGGLANDDFVKDTSDLYAAAVIGDFGVINAELWGTTLQGAVDHLIMAQVGAKFAGLSLKGQASHSKLDAEFANDLGYTDGRDGEFYGLEAKYDINNFRLGAGATTTKGDTGINNLSADGSMIQAGKQSNYLFNNRAKTETYFANAGAQFGKIGVDAGYVLSKIGDESASYINDDFYMGDKAEEFYAQVSYKYNKNFDTYIYYSDVSSKDNANAALEDSKRIRFESKYKF